MKLSVPPALVEPFAADITKASGLLVSEIVQMVGSWSLHGGRLSWLKATEKAMTVDEAHFIIIPVHNKSVQVACG